MRCWLVLALLLVRHRSAAVRGGRRRRRGRRDAHAIGGTRARRRASGDVGARGVARGGVVDDGTEPRGGVRWRLPRSCSRRGWRSRRASPAGRCSMRPAAMNLLVGNNPRATGRLDLGDEAWLRDTYIAGRVERGRRQPRARSRPGCRGRRRIHGAWLRLAARQARLPVRARGPRACVGLWPRLLRRAVGDDGDAVGLAAAGVVSGCCAWRRRFGVVRAPRPAPAALVAIGAVVVGHRRAARAELRREPLPSAARPAAGGGRRASARPAAPWRRDAPCASRSWPSPWQR